MRKSNDITINQNLLWDRKFSEEEMKTEYFTLWYIARVLTAGISGDVTGVGIEMSRKNLPRLNLPERIRRFWDFYNAIEEDF